MTDSSVSAPEAVDVETLMETQSEKEPELSDSAAEEQRRMEQENPPANLEKVRETTSESLESAMEFWKTPTAQKNSEFEFMEYKNQNRRDLLLKSFAVICDESSFGNPEVLQALLAVLGKEVSLDVSAAGVTDQSTGEVAEQNASNTTQAEGSAPATEASQKGLTTEKLQEAVLSVVHELLFEQLYADLMQCKATIQKQTSDVIGLVNDHNQLSADMLQEKIDMTQQYQTDSGLFDTYLAKGEALMRICLRAPSLSAETTATLREVTLERLKSITEEYAEDTGKGDLSKAIQVGDDAIADPVVYFQNERTEVMGDLIGQNTFFEAMDTLNERLKALQADATQENAEQVQEAKADVQEAAQATQADQFDAVKQQGQPDAPPATVEQGASYQDFNA